MGRRYFTKIVFKVQLPIDVKIFVEGQKNCKKNIMNYDYFWYFLPVKIVNSYSNDKEFFSFFSLFCGFVQDELSWQNVIQSVHHIEKSIIQVLT